MTIASRSHHARHEAYRKYSVRWIHERPTRKRVRLVYPGEVEDRMSLTEFKRWSYRDYPVGTKIWIDGEPYQEPLRDD